MRTSGIAPQPLGGDLTTPREVVIGSGPAALGAVHGLVARGRRPLVIDAGITVGDALSTAHPGSGGLPDKLLFGSDHPYRTPRALPHDYAPEAGVRGSFALGGLSTVWGSAVMPYGPREMRGWPIGPSDLAPHMARLADVVPVSASTDDALARAFPLPLTPRGALPGTPGMDRMAARFDRRAPRRVVGGRARLAVDPGDGPTGCISCGECITGCPTGAIFDAGRVIRQMADAGALEYRGGMVVLRVEPTPAGPVVHVCGPDGARRDPITASRVFVGAGVVGTAGIVMRSSGGAIREVTALDSQYFMAPVVRVGRDAIDGDRVTLAQVFVEVADAARGGDIAHLQLYAPNELMRDMVATRLRVAPRRVATGITRHLVGVQGFLHSDWSGRLVLRADGDHVRVTGMASGASRQAARAALRGLRRAWRQVGGVPVASALVMAEPGRGFHVGGTFPMRHDPGEAEVDTLGVMPGLPGVHLVDASIFPTVPACTITIPVMANARRIAEAAA